MPADVTIIGAGPAGCVAAILLARAGWDVTLVEQHRFPRDKVCGECLSALGVDVLRRNHLADAVLKLGPSRFHRSIVVAPSGRSIQFDLPHTMWGVTRAALDACLLGLARQAGATVVQPARCEAIEIEPRLSVQLRDLATNQVRTAHPSHVLLADGKAALAVDRPAPTGDLGVKAHFRGVTAPRDAILLFGLHGHYVGLAAVEGGLWNLAMNVPAWRVRAYGGDFDALLDRMVQENEGLRVCTARAERVGDWLASPLPRFPVSRDWPRGVIPLGNAAAALEPIGGEGMGLALRSAELAAEALIAAERSGTLVDVAALRRSFDRLWRTRRFACRAAALAASSPAIAGVGAEAFASSEWLQRLALDLAGKAVSRPHAGSGA